MVKKKEFGLSYGQKSLWFQQQLHPDSYRYNLTFATKVTSFFDIEKFRSAVQQLILKYDALRTRYYISENRLVQSVNETDTPDFLILDAESWSLEEINLKIEEEAQCPFDLTAGQLLRVRVLRRSPGQHIFLLSVHHIAVDLWSMVSLVRDLGDAYSGKNILDCNQSVINNYQSYIDFQMTQLIKPSYIQLEKFWDNYLAGDIPLITLPTDFPRPAKKTQRAAIEKFRVGQDHAARLRKFSLDNGVTLYVTLITAYFLMLYQYTKQTELVIGSPFSGRTDFDFRKTFGFFVNPVVLRVAINENLTFLELLQEVNMNIASVFQNQNFPFSVLVEKKSAIYDPSRSPIYDIEFVYDRPIKIPKVAPFILGEPGALLELGGLSLESLHVNKSCIEKDLQLFITDDKEILYCGLLYATDLFEPSTIRNMGQQYIDILHRILELPDEKISKTQFSNQQKINKIIYDWNATDLSIPKGLTLIDLFEKQVALRENNIAVCDDEHSFTFKQINHMANRFAAELIKHNVIRADRVAIYLPRTAAIVVCILAINKVGAMYLPLDCHAPKTRNNEILNDAKPKALITNNINETRDFEKYCKIIVCNYSILNSEPVSKNENVKISITEDDFAYLIYTSGSSGIPKGVMVQHRSVVNLFYALTNSIEVYRSDKKLKVGVNAPVFFDSSVKQLIMLLAGHTLDIVPAEVKLNANDFVDYINDRQIDVFDITPSQIEILIAEDLFTKAFQTVKTVLIGGEKISPEVWGKIAQAENVKAYNVYGPTECTVDATIAPIIVADRSLPVLGKPLNNMQIYILDNYLNSVFLGMPGEICIGGSGVSIGYLNNPALTASKFIPNPFSREMGTRLYKTGDLGRYRQDGSIEYLGRLDSQVKIRGYRIELGEIESALMSIGEIKQCAVIANQVKESISSLVAYIVPVKADNFSITKIRESLAGKIPSYMCPNHYVILEALPVTSNGKLDLKKLPDFQNNIAQDKLSKLEQKTKYEIWLVSLWQKLLKFEPNIDDNFFELGGHSLLVMQIIARIQAEYKIKIAITEFFEQPTIKKLAKLIESRQFETNESVYEIEKIINRPSTFYASYQQKRLWFLDQIMLNNPAYNITGAAIFSGIFDYDLFLESLAILESNHEILRTAFFENESDVFQEVLPDLLYKKDLTKNITKIEMLNSNNEFSQHSVDRLIKNESLKPFNLKTGHLWRVLVIKENENKHIVVLTMHHIISDGWSNRLFLQKLIHNYDALLRGNSFLAHTDFQYIDYTNWHRKWLNSTDMEKQISYWKTKLSGASGYLNLPIDNSRPPVQKYLGASCSFIISTEKKASLLKLSNTYSVTLFMMMMSIFKLLLYRYSNQEDILIGTPVAGRRSKDTESMLGLFVNTLVIRSQLLSSMRFTDLLQQIKETTLSAFDNQDCPFEQIVEALKPDRDLSRSPLFQVMFIVENIMPDLFNNSSMTITPLPLSRNTAKFDLTLEIKNEDGLSGLIEYNTEIFSSASIERMIGHYLNLIEKVIDDPLLLLNQYQLISLHEYQNISKLWGKIENVNATNKVLIKQFEDISEQNSEQIAIITNQTNLTYKDLNQKANQLANYLLTRGLKKANVIGIFLPREAEMIISMLAVLKIGGMYVPLDPKYPLNRTHTILDSSQASFVISITSLKQNLPKLDNVEIICIDECASNIASQNKSNLEIGIYSNDNTYIIYTSGSTGVPKGVVINNQNVTNLIEWAHTTFSREEFSAVLASTSICFDLSIFEIFGTLTIGGTLYLVENALALIDQKNTYPITLINTVPSIMKELLIAEAIPTTVVTINLAGEPLMNQLAQAIYNTTNILYLYNLYGPSETTTYSTYTLVPREFTLPACYIGKPIANTFIYVLDQELNPLPIGIPGEIYISGLGVAQGYWNNPELSAERFIPDSLQKNITNDYTRHMYKTGDFGKLLADGNLVYLGRYDHQVKVRGYRIEITEIEAVLNSHPEIDTSVVTTWSNKLDETCLVAYVKKNNNVELCSEILFDYMKQYLPEYMMPSVINFVDEIPLNANGKINRSLLPDPIWNNFKKDSSNIQPPTFLQNEILEIWKIVLNRNEISLDDNFFKIGGHSLLATRMLIRINNQFNLSLPIRTIFESPKLVDFTVQVEKELLHVQNSIEPEIKRVNRNNNLELSDAQRRMWLLNRLYEKSSNYNMIAAFKLTGYFDEALFKKVLTEIVNRHEILRTTFVEVEGKPTQVISVPTLLDVSLCNASSQQINEFLKHEANHVFDLAVGPLFKIKIIYLDDASCVLIVNMHHIIADGWSVGVLIKEVSLLWNAFKSGEITPLQELPIQYADYSAWQNDRLKSSKIEQQLNYWKKQLSGHPGALSLINDKTSFNSESLKAGHLSIEISATVLSNLNRIFQEQNATLFMGLTAALAILINLYSDVEDLIIGTVVANRIHPHLEPLIGFFANTLALRIDLSKDLPFTDFLYQIKKTILLAYENQELPFERLVDEIQPIRIPNKHPLFQIMLILQNTAIDEINLDGIQIEPIEIELEDAKFDLLFNFIEKNGCLYGKFEFNANIYDLERMKKMLNHLVQILNNIVIDPACSIRRLLMAERKVPTAIHFASDNIDRILEDLILSD